jgi:hypothetical protein
MIIGGRFIAPLWTKMLGGMMLTGATAPTVMTPENAPEVTQAPLKCATSA